MVDAIAEEGAIGEAGQRIVEGLVSQLLLERLALGDVAVVDHDAADGRIALHVAGGRLEHAPRTVRVPGAQLNGPLSGGYGQDFRERGVHEGQVVRMKQLEDRLAESVFCLVPEDALDRRALIRDVPFCADDQEHVR